MKAIDVVITIAVVLGYFLLSSKKKKSKPQPRTKPHYPPYYTPSYEVEEEMSAPTIEKETEWTYPDITSERLENEYFTYENIESPITSSAEVIANSHLTNDVVQQMQENDEEEDKKPELIFTKEEFYKGIIYSEILKRPYS